MRNIHFGSGDITTLILIKEDAIIESDINKHYVTPLENRGLDRENIAVYGLLYEDSKIKAELGKNYLRMLLSKINKMNTVQNLIVADTSYFKWLIKKSKITDCYGETFKPKFEGYEDFKAHVLSLNMDEHAAITGVAAAADNTFGLNPAMMVRKTPGTFRQVDIQANTAILTQLVANLEMAKVSLRKETPLIQVIDKPILPLKKDKVGKLESLLLGGFLALFLTANSCIFFKS